MLEFMWIFFGLIASAVYSVAVIADNYLTNQGFKKTTSLVFYATLTTLFFVPIAFIFEMPDFAAGLREWPVFLTIGAIEVFYLFPYYKALQMEDTSVVISLFSIGRIFLPILAFVFLGEVLVPLHYLGFFIIILSSTLATARFGGRKIKLNKAIFYMLAVTLLISCQGVAYKYALNQTSWSTNMAFSTFFAVLIAALFLLVPKARTTIVGEWPVFLNLLKPMFITLFMTYVGVGIYTYAVTMAPITLASAVFATTPFFTMVYALLFRRYLPDAFKERLDARSILRKALLFLLMIAGILLIRE